MEQTGDVLINIMADKTRSVAEIDAAFQMFCAKYELRLNRLVEVQCAKLGYSAEIAFKAVECAFARVRRYPTFDKMKTKVKNIDNAIVSWLNRIAYTQVLKFKNGNECAEVNTDEDLAVVNDATGFYEVVSQRQYMSDEEKEEKFSSYLHDVIMSGYDGVVKLKANEIKEEEPELSDEDAIEKAKLKLTGIISGGFDVIYLIAQKLV